MSTVPGPIAPLLGDVLEFADYAIDLVIGHSTDQRGREHARDVDVVFGFHGALIAPGQAERERGCRKRTNG